MTPENEAKKESKGDELKYGAEWVKNECRMKKGMYDMEYTSFIFNIALDNDLGIERKKFYYDMNKSTAELLADQLTKEKFNILGKVADATIGAHIKGTKAMTPEESKAWHETHAYYDKNGHFIISPDPVEYDGVNKIKPNIKI